MHSSSSMHVKCVRCLHALSVISSREKAGAQSQQAHLTETTEDVVRPLQHLILHHPALHACVPMCRCLGLCLLHLCL